MESRLKRYEKAVEDLRALVVDVATISAQFSSLEGRLNETQRALRLVQRSNINLEQKTRQNEEGLKEFGNVQTSRTAEESPPEESSYLSELGAFDILLWSIPAILFLGGLGVIIIVLVRRNSETRRLAADSMRHTSRNTTPSGDQPPPNGGEEQ